MLSYVSSDDLPERMHSHNDYISLTFFLSNFKMFQKKLALTMRNLIHLIARYRSVVMLTIRKVSNVIKMFLKGFQA